MNLRDKEPLVNQATSIDLARESKKKALKNEKQSREEISLLYNQKE